MDAVKVFFKVYKIYTQLSLPFCALLDDVSESDDVVCTASSFWNPAYSFLSTLSTAADNHFTINNLAENVVGDRQ